MNSDPRPNDSPASADSILERIDARLGQIEARLARLEKGSAPLREAPNGLAAMTDTADHWISHMQERGVDVDDRLRHALELLEKVTQPDALDSLRNLVDTAEQLPGGLATAADTFDGILDRLAEAGIDVDERVHVVLQVAERLTAPEALAVVRDLLAHTDVVRTLLESGAFDPSAVRVVGCAARAIGDVDLDQVRPTGALGAFRSLSKPGVKQAIGLLVAFGQAFGQRLSDPPMDCDLRK
ncbi:MAG: hypothetical protein AAF196_15080 [Planctomycetota bacterium]